MTTFTANGISYDTDDMLGYGLYDLVTTGSGDTNVPRWLAAHFDLIADSQNNGVSTSSTSLSIGTGTKAFVLDTDIPAFAGLRGVAVDTASATNKMYFEVTSYDSGTKTLTTSVDATGGSGTIASWNIKIGLGPTGATGGGLADLVDDTTPQLGGDMDVNGNAITSATNGDIDLQPNGTGKVNMGDKRLQRAVLMDFGLEHVSANSGSTYTIEITDGNSYAVTLTANCTFTFSNPTATGDLCAFSLIIIQDGTGSRTITWPASVDWDLNGTVPTASTGIGEVDIYSFRTYDGGTTWYGVQVGKDFA